MSTKDNEELCIAVAGSVDSGKSSFLGVMVYGELDDGNGSAREKIAKHPHEVETGRTSDISLRSLVIDNKEIVFADLPGHEPYLKTALYGITGNFPDYGILVVAGHRGILPMTKEHLSIFLHLKVPFIILVTHADMAPDKIYENIMKTIKTGLTKVGKKVVVLNSKNDEETEDKTNNAIKCATLMYDNVDIVPVITVSNKTGYYIETIKKMLLNLKNRKTWKSEEKTVFYIDSRFNPKGIGIVISGICKGKSIKVGDKLYLGPYGNDFVPIKVWSIHDNNKNSLQELTNGHRGCLAIHILDKKLNFGYNSFKKGMVIVSDDYENSLCYQFKASVKILNHSATIGNNYSPVIHAGTVRQTARLILNKDKTLKIGDEDSVEFRFIGHPEFLEHGSLLFFREGTTRGVGKITELLALKDDPNKQNDANRTRRRFKRRRRDKKVKNN
jgi:GTPase